MHSQCHITTNFQRISLQVVVSRSAASSNTVSNDAVEYEKSSITSNSSDDEND